MTIVCIVVCYVCCNYTNRQLSLLTKTDHLLRADTAGLFAAHNQAAGNVLCTVMSISTPYQYMILLEFTIFEIVFSFVS